ncbi:hypothetical protein [Mycobacterium sp. URHB0021]
MTARTDARRVVLVEYLQLRCTGRSFVEKHQQISDTTGIPVRTLKRDLQWAVGQGLIEVSARFINSSRRANRYRLLPAARFWPNEVDISTTSPTTTSVLTDGVSSSKKHRDNHYHSVGVVLGQELAVRFTEPLRGSARSPREAACGRGATITTKARRPAAAARMWAWDRVVCDTPMPRRKSSGGWGDVSFFAVHREACWLASHFESLVLARANSDRQALGKPLLDRVSDKRFDSWYQSALSSFGESEGPRLEDVVDALSWVFDECEGVLPFDPVNVFSPTGRGTRPKDRKLTRLKQILDNWDEIGLHMSFGSWQCA